MTGTIPDRMSRRTLVGAWIETRISAVACIRDYSRTLVGAWIETR